MPTTAIVIQTAAKATKTTMPIVTSLYLRFNLQLRNGELSFFREAVLKCIAGSEVREIFSNETKDKDGKQKNLVHYPLVQYRVRNGFAVIWCMQAAVPLVEKFVQQYRQELSLAV